MAVERGSVRNIQVMWISSILREVMTALENLWNAGYENFGYRVVVGILVARLERELMHHHGRRGVAGQPRVGDGDGEK